MTIYQLCISFCWLSLTIILGCQPSTDDKGNQRADSKPASQQTTPQVETENESKAVSSDDQEQLPVQRPSPGQPWFVDGTQPSGLVFRHLAGRTEERFLPEIMGSGVLVADFNRDGAPDILMINGGDPKSLQRPSEAKNRLFLNDGQGGFYDATEEWNLPSSAYGMGGAVGDFNNDGWPDVYLTTYGGGDTLLKNMGDRFVDVTSSSGVQPDSKWSSSALFFDADNDGWLDLLVIRYVEYTEKNAVPTYFNGIHVYSTPHIHEGIPDRLFKNNRDGTFTEIIDFHPLPEGNADNQENPFKGLAVGAADLTGNGLPDLYVANDIRRNFLLFNQGDFKFEESGILYGVAYGDTGTAQAGMGVAFVHLDDQGIPAISCANFQGEPANFFVPRKNMFVERTDVVGVSAATRQRLQWGMVFFDANNDGTEEFMVANGHIYDNVDQLYTAIGFAQQNTLLRMEHGKFHDISDAAGPALKVNQVSRGLAIGDFNGDGRLDFVVSNNDQPVQLGINTTPEPGNFVSLWLEGVSSNRSAIGAKLEAKIGDRTLVREIFGGGSYLSASDLRVHFGLGEATEIEQLKIRWPSGLVQIIESLSANQFYHLIEDQSPAIYSPGEKVIPPQSR